MARVQRGDVSSLLLPDEVSEEILRGAAEASLIQRFGRSRPMTAQNVKLTEAEVTGANVFWVGEGARKQTDAPGMQQLTWSMSAAELAVIVPLDENVQEDASIDIFDLYKPAIETAIGKKLDSAALFGVDSPTEWAANGSIRELTTAAGQHFAEDVDPTDEEYRDLITGSGASTPDGALQAVEEGGYDPNAFLAYVRLRSRFRHMKDADGRYVFGDAVQTGVPASLFGVPTEFTKKDIWTPATTDLIVGDWDSAVVGTRQGIRYRIFDQGVITDGAGAVVYSLMEQDMIALRVTARFGFKVIADDTADTGTVDGSSDFPFASIGANGTT